MSLWILDLAVHRRDLPIVPGSALKVGFGLRDSLAAELAVFAAGILLCVRATRPADRTAARAAPLANRARSV